MKKTTRASRFTKKIDSEVLEFSESLTVDIVLLEADLKVTSAHVEMLAKCRLITKKELTIILSGLKKIKEAVKNDATDYIVSKIKKLKDLLDEGILTEEEYQKKKDELVSQI